MGLRLKGRHTYGGRAEYLFYSKEAGEFVERSSGTTTSELSVGLTSITEQHGPLPPEPLRPSPTSLPDDPCLSHERTSQCEPTIGCCSGSICTWSLRMQWEFRREVRLATSLPDLSIARRIVNLTTWYKDRRDLGLGSPSRTRRGRQEGRRARRHKAGR